MGGLSGRRPLRVQVVAWGRQQGLARAPCRFAPCLAGLPWTSHESIGDSNCSTSFITSFNHLHHHTLRGECRFQRERNSIASDLWRQTPQKLKAKRRKPSKAFRFYPSQISVDEFFSWRESGCLILDTNLVVSAFAWRGLRCLCVLYPCVLIFLEMSQCARVWVPWFWFALLNFNNPQLFPLALVFCLGTPDEPSIPGGVLVDHNLPSALNILEASAT